MERTPVTPADAAAVSEIVRAVETSLYGPSTYSQADLEDEWAELELERDVRVVRDGDRVVGYDAVRERASPWRVEGYVHPDARGRGIGTLLATGLEQDAARAGARRIQNSVLETDAAACALLESLGYAAVRMFREMRIELDAPPPRPNGRTGYASSRSTSSATRASSTPPTRRRSPTTGTTCRATSTPGRSPTSQSERFDPALWCVVRAGDEIAAGTISTGDTYGGGFVHALFTRRPWRRQGVGAALLADAFGRLWERGERSVGLGVDAASDTGAFRLYERAGMSPALGWVLYEKAL